MADKKTSERSEQRKGWCPVYDLACPAGAAAADACDERFHGDYNPLTSFRDADISHCALYRQEQIEAGEIDVQTDGGKGDGDD
jgi:hypothetical protein